MSLTAAIEEAYAANPAGEVVFETLELDHITFVAPIRVVVNHTDDLDLPLTLGGTPVTFTACGAAVTRPGIDDDGPTPMRIRIDNVSQLLQPYLRDAIAATNPITVTYRAYSSTDLTQPGEVIGGLEIRDVSLTATAAEGSVSFRQIELQAFPLRTYDQEYYPALMGD